MLLGASPYSPALTPLPYAATLLGVVPAAGLLGVMPVVGRLGVTAGKGATAAAAATVASDCCLASADARALKSCIGSLGGLAEADGPAEDICRVAASKATGSGASVLLPGREEGSPSRSRDRRSAVREEKTPSRKREACCEYCNAVCDFWSKVSICH
jgi:hypothetical protein